MKITIFIIQLIIGCLPFILIMFWPEVRRMIARLKRSGR
jgi:hypothetical protein